MTSEPCFFPDESHEHEDCAAALYALSALSALMMSARAALRDVARMCP